MTTPIIRPANASDLARFFDAAPPRTMRAFVAELAGEPVAVAGIAYQHGGPPYLFSDMKPAMRAHKIAIVKGARTMLKALARPGLPAIANGAERCSARLLRHLGFVSAGQTAQGELFVFKGAAT
jgi:hypothetical protein